MEKVAFELRLPADFGKVPAADIIWLDLRSFFRELSGDDPEWFRFLEIDDFSAIDAVAPVEDFNLFFGKTIVPDPSAKFELNVFVIDDAPHDESWVIEMCGQKNRSWSAFIFFPLLGDQEISVFVGLKREIVACNYPFFDVVDHPMFAACSGWNCS